MKFNCNRDQIRPLGTQCSVVEPAHAWIVKLDNLNTLYLNSSKSSLQRTQRDGCQRLVETRAPVCS